METRDLAVTATGEVEAASLGITPGYGYHVVIKEMKLQEKTGTSKKGQPFRIVGADFTCQVINCLSEDISEASCKGQLVHMRINNRPEEPDDRILSYIKGLMRDCGITLDDYSSSEVIAGDVVGKEFDCMVKEDKMGYAYISTNTLRALNR